MQTREAFHLWSRLHDDLLRFLDRVPGGDLNLRADGHELDIGTLLRRVVASEEYWRRAVLEPEATYVELTASDCPDRDALRSRMKAAFAATERLLDGSRVDALRARPLRSSLPVANALEALTFCHIQTVHHRTAIASQLRALGVDIEEWI